MTTNIKILAKRLSTAAIMAVAAHANPGFAAPLVHTTDFINDSSRTGFNGFEELNEPIIYGLTTHTEQNIRVERTGLVDNIWTVSGANDRVGFDGARSWYPGAVLNYPIVTGYDRITLASGGAFDSVGMLVGSGFGGYCLPNDCEAVAQSLSLYYELFYQGASVASGTLAHSPNAHYLGFSGGGFDEIRLWDRSISGWPDQNALLIDSIEITSTVPEPTTYAMTLLALGLLAGSGARRRSKDRKF